MKVLNLYACVGGNRTLWKDCEVTAIELDPECARIYQERFPNDIVIVTDAHEYLLEHYLEFDMIWLSRPCWTHSKARYWASKGGRYDVVYPDMTLYQEIIFLKNFYSGVWVSENVNPYYTPILEPTKIGRHLFWSSFKIPIFKTVDADIKDGNLEQWQEFHDVDISSYKGKQRKDKILRNMVHFDTGLHIFNLARGVHESNKVEQSNLFNQ